MTLLKDTSQMKVGLQVCCGTLPVDRCFLERKQAANLADSPIGITCVILKLYKKIPKCKDPLYICYDRSYHLEVVSVSHRVCAR